MSIETQYWENFAFSFLMNTLFVSLSRLVVISPPGGTSIYIKVTEALFGYFEWYPKKLQRSVVFWAWRRDNFTPLSSAEAPSVGKTERKRGKERENGEIKKSGARGGTVGRATSVSLLPSSRTLYFPFPHSPAYRKDERHLCGEEWFYF